MFDRHRLETEARLSAIESHLGGPWRERAACAGLDGFIQEPTSRDKKEARTTGFRPPTAGERRAFAICADCPVRRSCARASLTPPPRHPELPPLRDPLDHEPFGIWCGVRADDRRKLVDELGTGPDALEALLRLGAKMAQESSPPAVRSSRLWGGSPVGK
ncbi:MAG: WhiB family transcriptional regulator [Actinomycetota bacterium]